jgi:glycosyltransferase involved in cell wall biosynthesis
MPQVSIIVPCYNEEKTIELLLSAIYRQTWPKSALEVVIVDGLSTDATRQAIARFQQTHPDLAIHLIDNARRIIPAALNCAIAAAQGEYIVRLDAHSEPEADYVERSLADLQSGAGEMVGGVWQIRPSGSGWLARSIAIAAAHPFGVGDALYRYTTRPAWVDTVPFGAFRRSLVDRIGFYDETLLTNEDYEFNTRIRQSGGRIWLNPAIRSTYYARPDLNALARQYWRYGYWKFQMLRRYPDTLRWRQALPPVFVLSLVFWGILALFWNVALWMGLVEIGLYAAILILGSVLPAWRQKDVRLLVGIPLAITTMHCAWGAGLIGSMVKSLLRVRVSA